MAAEIRPIRAEENDAFRQLRAYAFAAFQEDLPDVPPETSLCAFVDGELAASSAAWPFKIRANGTAMTAAGITMVATWPAHRRRGLLRSILTRALPICRERGQAVAMLWASFGAIYQRFGFGPASQGVFYRIDPRQAALLPPALDAGEPARIEMRPAAEALAELKPIYVAHVASGMLSLHRGEALWRYGILRARRGEGVYAAICRRPDGTATGYAVYGLRGPEAGDARDPELLPPQQELQVRDWVAGDAQTYRALWGFLCSHDLVGRLRLGPLPPDDPAPLLLAEPRQLRRLVNDGLWLRIVDAERALTGRGYGTAGEVTLEIRGDDLCPWNNRAMQLRSDGTAAEVSRARGVPDLVLPPRSLATLWSGHASASELCAAGLLDAKDPGVLARADALFATRRRPFCPDQF
jgi:predicted acetyltransferase